MTETLLPIVQKINGYLSDYILVALLIAVGLWYSIKTRFVQLRCFKEGWNSVFGGHLRPGCLVNTTAEIVLAELPDTVFTRERDEATGYEELAIRRIDRQF